MDTLAIIKRVEARLIEIGMTKMDFYEASGVTSASYSQWNTGLYNPSKKSIAKMAAAIKVTPEYLLTGENGQKNTATTNSDGTSLSDIELINAFKSSDEATQELIRRVLGLQ